MERDNHFNDVNLLHIEENLKKIKAALGIEDSLNRSAAQHKGKILSIHLQSNRANNFKKFLDNLEATADDLNSFEVIVKIDDHDEEMNHLLKKEAALRNFTIKYLSTPLEGGFFGLWSSMNDIFKIADPDVYFFVNFNDEMYFKNKGWDTILKKYVGLFPDHVFRLRTSRFRFRNYYDFWECGFAPETSAITTRKWLELGGNWNPCLGPDSFQQCVAYYFGYHERFNMNRFIREIPIYDILIGGEGAGKGLKGKELENFMRGAVKAWYKLMSYENQTEASRRARKLYAYVWAKQNNINGEFSFIDNKKRKTIQIRDKNGLILRKEFSYKISYIKLMMRNFLRFFNYYSYGGAGNEIKMTKWQCFKKMIEYRYAISINLENLYQRRKEQAKLEKNKVEKKYISLSVVWPTYTNQGHIILTSPLLVKQIKELLIQDAIDITVEVHPAYIIMRLRYPADITANLVIEKIRLHSRVVVKKLKRHPQETAVQNWLKVISQDNYFIYTDATAEKNALNSWELLGTSHLSS